LRKSARWVIIFAALRRGRHQSVSKGITIVKRWRLYLLTTILVLVGVVVAVGLATRLGFGPLVDAVRRDPQRCLFADESTWDICKSWLAQPGATSKASTFLTTLSVMPPS
jgi:hypothetical protein